MRAIDTTLYHLREDWLVNEILLLMARTLRRLDLTARSLFAVVDEGSCFAGSLLEIALAADRIYMLRDAAGAVRAGIVRAERRPAAHDPRPVAIAGALPGRPRARRRDRRANPNPSTRMPPKKPAWSTAAVDEIDWEDELRVAIEERVSLSPDALTGMEANLRFAGAENADSKIFGRLSAWQNWIFSRPNATGERGALTLYGKPERPQFNWRRT